jgi:hypothetical protein
VPYGPYRSQAEQQQHVLMFRKLLLRRRLMRWVRGREGAAYVPFCGDADIARELYGPWAVYGADIDPKRVQVATSRVQGTFRVADCDQWVFPELSTPVVVADFDAYSEPYTSFRSFWEQGPRAERMAVFFTDGHRMGLIRTGAWHRPDGSLQTLDKQEKLPIYFHYLSKHVFPWFDAYVGPEYRVLEHYRYLRDQMVYWGAAVERVPTLGAQRT